MGLASWWQQLSEGQRQGCPSSETHRWRKLWLSAEQRVQLRLDAELAVTSPSEPVWLEPPKPVISL